MKGIIAWLLAVSALIVSGCATCAQSDNMCKEKQSAEYARPFYIPPDRQIP